MKIFVEPSYCVLGRTSLTEGHWAGMANAFQRSLWGFSVPCLGLAGTSGASCQGWSQWLGFPVGSKHAHLSSRACVCLSAQLVGHRAQCKLVEVSLFSMRPAACSCRVLRSDPELKYTCPGCEAGPFFISLYSLKELSHLRSRPLDWGVREGGWVPSLTPWSLPGFSRGSPLTNLC